MACALCASTLRADALAVRACARPASKHLSACTFASRGSSRQTRKSNIVQRAVPGQARAMADSGSGKPVGESESAPKFLTAARYGPAAALFATAVGLGLTIVLLTDGLGSVQYTILAAIVVAVGAAFMQVFMAARGEIADSLDNRKEDLDNRKECREEQKFVMDKDKFVMEKDKFAVDKEKGLLELRRMQREDAGANAVTISAVCPGSGPLLLRLPVTIAPDDLLAASQKLSPSPRLSHVAQTAMAMLAVEPANVVGVVAVTRGGGECDVMEGAAAAQPAEWGAIQGLAAVRIEMREQGR